MQRDLVQARCGLFESGKYVHVCWGVCVNLCAAVATETLERGVGFQSGSHTVTTGQANHLQALQHQALSRIGQ